MLVELDASLASLDQTRATDLDRRVLERMRGEPGVVSAALASNVPFSSISDGEAVRLSGAAEDAAVDAEHYVVTTGYFETMGLALLRGPDLSVRQRRGRRSSTPPRPAPVVIDEPLARQLRPDGDVIGQRLVISTPREGEKEKTVEIVGIVPGVRLRPSHCAERSTVYLPFGGNYTRAHMIVHLNVANDDEDARARRARDRRLAIWAIDARLPILSMKKLSGHLEQGLERWMVIDLAPHTPSLRSAGSPRCSRWSASMA